MSEGDAEAFQGLRTVLDELARKQGIRLHRRTITVRSCPYGPSRACNSAAALFVSVPVDSILVQCFTVVPASSSTSSSVAVLSVLSTLTCISQWTSGRNCAYSLDRWCRMGRTPHWC